MASPIVSAALDSKAASADAARIYSERGRYVPITEVFRDKPAPVPPHSFESERVRALDPATPAGFIALDLGPVLGLGYPATTPLMLMRYVVLGKGETLSSRFRSSTEFYYVIKGSGRSANGGDVIRWSEGDAFSFAGGGETVHRADAPALLFLATDEPALAFYRLDPPDPGRSATPTVLYPAARIEAEIAAFQARPKETDQPGTAIWFTSEEGKPLHTFAPPLIAALNTLEAGGYQRPHRHNAAAVTLCIQGEGCQGEIDGRKMDWQPYGVMVTPGAAIHAFWNRGERMMRCLIFQDYGMHAYLRTNGFAFED